MLIFRFLAERKSNLYQTHVEAKINILIIYYITFSLMAPLYRVDQRKLSTQDFFGIDAKTKKTVSTKCVSHKQKLMSPRDFFYFSLRRKKPG